MALPPAENGKKLKRMEILINFMDGVSRRECSSSARCKAPTVTTNYMKVKKPTDNILRQLFVTQTKGFVDVSAKQSFWTDFAKQTGGSFKVKQTVSRDLTLFNLIVPFENGQIEFNESDTHPFKVVCIINSDKNVDFTITQEDFADRFLKVFSNHDIEISNPDFDKKYLVKGSDKRIIKNILNADSIIPLILKTNIFSISCERESKQLKIMGMVGRSVNSLNEMQDVYCLFKAIIDQIEKL